LITPSGQGARTADQLPAALDAAASCDLDGDGFFDGDGRDDLVVRTHRGETEDTVALYPGAKSGLLARTPVLSFSTSGFLAR